MDILEFEYKKGKSVLVGKRQKKEEGVQGDTLMNILFLIELSFICCKRRGFRWSKESGREGLSKEFALT